MLTFVVGLCCVGFIYPIRVVSGVQRDIDYFLSIFRNRVGSTLKWRQNTVSETF
jgi:hypothetical protein